MKARLSKIFTRKFILSALTTIGGIATACSASGNAKLQIAGLTVAAASTIAYNVVEGNIDAKAVVAVTAETLDKINKLVQEESEVK
jgi:hypothetical protein